MPSAIEHSGSALNLKQCVAGSYENCCWPCPSLIEQVRPDLLPVCWHIGQTVWERTTFDLVVEMSDQRRQIEAFSGADIPASQAFVRSKASRRRHANVPEVMPISARVQGSAKFIVDDLSPPRSDQASTRMSASFLTIRPSVSDHAVFFGRVIVDRQLELVLYRSHRVHSGDVEERIHPDATATGNRVIATSRMYRIVACVICCEFLIW